MIANDFNALVNGKKVVISGKFEKIDRDILGCIVEWCGGTLSKSVSKSTNYMIAGEDVGPSKLQKCRELNIPIITEDRVVELLFGTTITMPENILEISGSAFLGFKGLRKIILPKSLTKIGYRAFFDCKELEYINIPASVTEIGERPFEGCYGLKHIDFDSANRVYQMVDEVLIAGDYALWCTPGYDGKVTLPNSVKIIDSRCFYYSRVKEIEFPDSLVEIGEKAFYRCGNLTSINIPSSIRVIQESAFAFTTLKSIVVPEGVTEIGKGAFGFMKELETVKLPDSLKILGNDAFVGCLELKEINIPKSITSLEYETFNGCSSLETITLPSSVNKLGRKVFLNCKNLTKVVISEGAKELSISPDAFEGCYNLKELHIPASVEDFDASMFEIPSETKIIRN